MKNVRIMIVAEDAASRRSLRDGLAAEGWMVFEAESRRDALAMLERETVDLVVISQSPGQEDAGAFSGEIRAARNIPTILTGGWNSPLDRVRALAAGADDYLVRPFHLGELVLRTRRILGRLRRDLDADLIVTADHLTVDLVHHEVRGDDGGRLELTPAEELLFELFVRHPGRILTRDDISRLVFHREWKPFDRSIDGHVARLRQKLPRRPDGLSPIRSVRGVGYVYAEDVSGRDDQGAKS